MKLVIASLDVDAQNGFTNLCPLELPVPDALKIVPELQKHHEIAEFTVASMDEHKKGSVWEASKEKPMGSPIHGYLNVDRHWNRHCVENTFGAQLIDGLPEQSEYDLVIKKGQEVDCHPYGALWHDLPKTKSTGVIEFLNTNEVNVVIVGGLALDFCVRETIIELLAAGFIVVLNVAATKCVFPENCTQTLKELSELGCMISADFSEVLQRIDMLTNS